MSALAVVAVVLVVAVVVVLAIAASKPDTLHVARATTIQAPPEKIFPLIDDFRRWTEWSPYEGRDPDMKRTYGPRTYEWDGNRNVGAGRMETLESSPSRIAIKLDFLRPVEGHNVAEFTLEPSTAGTRVVWSMHGPAPFLSKLMQVFINMDRMIGRDFEAGLAGLKAAAEKS
jgi:hypothetical protein